jgi:hypothetical protein
MQDMIIQTHANFSNKNERTAFIKFIPHYKSFADFNYVVIGGTLNYIYGKYSGWVTDE